MKAPTLVVLAAGMGSRYGGIKQMDRIGKAGETLLDYSAHDAVAAGFGRIVFVLRRSIADDFKEIVLSRLEGKIDYGIAFQELDSALPPRFADAPRLSGRSKPWGTAHALLCAAPLLDAPFAVVNADDFYGRESFEAAAAFLMGPDGGGGVPVAGIVPYRLDKTLSEAGSVSRGLCRIEDGFLMKVEELPSIVRKQGRILATTMSGEEMELSPAAPVSMNFWAFPTSAIAGIRSYFEDFLEARSAEAKAEAFLPSAVDALVSAGKLRVKALAADAEWFGMTYREDRERTAKRIAELSADGTYPSPLWGNA